MRERERERAAVERGIERREREKVRERMSLLHILTYFCSSHTLSPTAAFAFNNEKEDEGGGG